jgi:hypothetical protein
LIRVHWFSGSINIDTRSSSFSFVISSTVLTQLLLSSIIHPKHPTIVFALFALFALFPLFPLFALFTPIETDKNFSQQKITLRLSQMDSHEGEPAGALL